MSEAPQQAVGTGIRNQRVLALVRGRPGQTIQDIADACGVSHASASYHLSGLARKGLVIAVKEGRMLRHYAPGTDPAVARFMVWAGDARRKALIEAFQQHPAKAWTVNQLAVHLGASHGFMSRSLMVLVREGLVRIDRRNWISYVRPSPLLLASKMLHPLHPAEPGEVLVPAPLQPGRARPVRA